MANYWNLCFMDRHVNGSVFSQWLQWIAIAIILITWTIQLGRESICHAIWRQEVSWINLVSGYLVFQNLLIADKLNYIKPNYRLLWIHFILSVNLNVCIRLAEQALCVDNIMKDLDDERRKCSCNVDCEENTYLPTISGSTFPSVKYAVGFYVLIQF